MKLTPYSVGFATTPISKLLPSVSDRGNTRIYLAGSYAGIAAEYDKHLSGAQDYRGFSSATVSMLEAMSFFCDELEKSGCVDAVEARKYLGGLLGDKINAEIYQTRYQNPQMKRLIELRRAFGVKPGSQL